MKSVPTLGTPTIGKRTYIDASAKIIGNVTIGEGVFVAPNATLRADEPGSQIIVHKGCNIQDNVVVHALRGSVVSIGEGTSVAHGAIVHGPCSIGERCFVGFGAVVFRSVLGDESVVQHRAVVTDAEVPSKKVVDVGAIIDGKKEVPELPAVSGEMRQFVDGVRQTNSELVCTYRKAGMPSLESFCSEGGKD